MPLSHALYVGMGGFAGSIARYLVTNLTQTTWAGSFPLGTLWSTSPDASPSADCRN